MCLVLHVTFSIQDLDRGLSMILYYKSKYAGRKLIKYNVNEYHTDIFSLFDLPDT